MDDLFMLSEAQMRRIAPYFPLSHGVPRVDDRRVISGIVFVLKNGLRWRDAPRAYEDQLYIGSIAVHQKLTGGGYAISIQRKVGCVKKLAHRKQRGR